MRTSTISAAAIGFAADCTSGRPLNSICQVRESTRIDSAAAKARPRVRSASASERSSATAGTIFTRVTKWVNSARSVEHHCRVGAGVVLVAQLLEGGRDIAAHQRLEQVDDAGAVGEAEHLAHVLGAHGAGRMRDRLVEQRQRVAHRAFGGARDQRERLRLGRDAFLGGDAFEMRDQRCPPRRGAGRSAGSATAPSPEPCGFRWSRRRTWRAAAALRAS